LSPAEIASLSKSFPEDSCPMALSKKYIYHYFMKIRDGELRGGSRNVSVNLIGKLFTPNRLSSPIADGRRGGSPLTAAQQILKVLFGNLFDGGSIVHLQGNWSNSCPRGDHKKIILRYGPADYEYIDTKALDSDSHPTFIKSRGGKISYKMSHLVYIMSRRSGGMLHAVLAYVCGNKKFVYDSNKQQIMEIDWSDHENLGKILQYSGASKLERVAYTLYVRE
jgi:hypothetical protein